MLLSAVGEVTYNGETYYQFYLDINESAGGNDTGEEFLSLDKLQIYTGTTENPSTEDLATLGTLRYDMGAGNGVLLNFLLGSGSGTSDMSLLVKKSLFGPETEYVYRLRGMGGGTGSDHSVP